MDAQYTGNQISRLRKALNLTQKELAEKLHVTDKAVSKWERGINFPDLGLMENLAEALGTTPAVLLGLEDAGQNETLQALAEISGEQLEEARSDLRIFSWGSIVVALLLALAYHLTQKRVVEVYYLLHSLITVIGIVGLLYLFKYEQIKKWEVPDLGSFLGALFSALSYFGYQFTTGYYPPQWAVAVMLGLTSLFTQIHFRQVMKPKFMQALPLILSAAFLLWDTYTWPMGIESISILIGCLAVWIIAKLGKK